MNFIVNAPDGTYFLKAIDASSKPHTAEYLLSEIENVIEQVGVEHVVQVEKIYTNV